MKKLGHIESLSLYLPIEPPLHAIHPPSFTWRLVSTLNQWEQKGKKQKEQKFSTHVYTYGNSKTSFYECTQASPVCGLRIRLRLLTEEFACLELIKGSDYSIHNGQGQVSMAELSL